MRSKSPRLSLSFVFIFVLSFSLLSGCTGQNGPSATPTPEATPVPPTATNVPAEIVYVNAQNSAEDEITTVITQFAAENSLQFRPAASLTSAEITSGTKIVVFDSDPGDLSGLSALAPSVQFLVLGSNSISAGGNISTIQSDPADTAFMAGYITMLLSEDWRAAALLTSDGPLGSSYADTFTNGARFVCGKCNPFYAPVVDLPVVASEPAGSDVATWTNDAVTLGKNWLSAAYIDPAAANVSVANALSAYPLNFESVIFIGRADVPADNGLAWDALLSTDAAPALKTMLPLLLSGQGGNQVNAQVILTAVNEETISPARQALFNQTAADLANGLIEPLTIQ